jgi:ornithine cyclodeaminase/alanine dehydrogenase-like protein (mu-crystallin family)
MRHLDAAAVWQGLGMRGAIDALDAAIGEHGFPPVPQRLHLRDDDQQLLVMPSFTGGWAGVKLITIDPANPDRGLPLIHGSYTLFGPPALAPVATIDGAALTELRTAAVSGLATRYLARPDASRLVILGAGAQGRSHLLAMAAVRPVSEVVIVAPRPASADAFLAFAADHLGGVVVRAGTPDDVADADLVCACTSSATPVFDGHRLPDGVHVNAIGAYLPSMAEVDPVTVASSRVVVETREAALAEKGDLLQAEAAGAWSRDQLAADLTGLVRDRVPVRTRDDERTLFASVGVAYEDLVVAQAVVEAAGAAA